VLQLIELNLHNFHPRRPHSKVEVQCSLAQMASADQIWGQSLHV
jgi:hypothetical protein